MPKILKKTTTLYLCLLVGLFLTSIYLTRERYLSDSEADNVSVLTGLDVLLSQQSEGLEGKTIALVTNHTGLDKNGIPNYINLMELEDVNLKVIFSPEHGLFGEATAGEHISYNEKNAALPAVISLYGKTKKPTKDMLENIDLILYDIQDIGARFYTYISTLGLVMETAGELGIPVLVLDRPNPIRGDRIEGPVLDIAYQSFVGYYPIPIQYGLTVGELAKMIVGENWIHPTPHLEVIQVQNWERHLWYDEINLPWIKPSPNIPDLETAIIYPGMCLMEGTNISEGRGTQSPFKQIGAPWIDGANLAHELNKQNLPGVVFSVTNFTPKSIPGMAMNPKYLGEQCNGIEIIITDRDAYRSVAIGVQILLAIHSLYPSQFQLTPFIDTLWGSNKLRYGIISGLSFEDITKKSMLTTKTLKIRCKDYIIY
ncbi:MAG: DUF1343 domain-containing protein [Candidatus Marinimicrobia bacterium]|nr:DUF1343 domain-containing protein [Candidatus Neomarinimicrobiota bacterium]